MMRSIVLPAATAAVLVGLTGLSRAAAPIVPLNSTDRSVTIPAPSGILEPSKPHLTLYEAMRLVERETGGKAITANQIGQVNPIYSFAILDKGHELMAAVSPQTGVTTLSPLDLSPDETAGNAD